jgi:hypothetical protein
VGPPTEAVAKVGLAGVEPATSRLSGVRSNHLSYKPIRQTAPPALAPQGIIKYRQIIDEPPVNSSTRR